jgi:hypothetical protein
MLYLRNTNQQQTLDRGITRGTLPNITASVTSSCIDYEDSGFIDINDIVGGRGPLYNYSLYDLSSSLFVTQSTTVSSASIDDLSNSTYLLNISNLGLFAYTQSVLINCPAPPDLQIEYLVVGGGGKVQIARDGGGAGGFLTGSISVPWRQTLRNTIGLGATGSQEQGGSSSISASILFVSASGGSGGTSGAPTINSAGLGGPPPIGTGGGAGAGEVGGNGVDGRSGDGGDGLQWLDGNYYAGGGGGGANTTVPAGNGIGGLGGGGNGDIGACTNCGTTGSNGTPNTGGGAGGGGYDGGSGVVIIRYSTGSVKPGFGGNVTEAGGYYYHTFTGSADFRYAKS